MNCQAMSEMTEAAGHVTETMSQAVTVAENVQKSKVKAILQVPQAIK